MFLRLPLFVVSLSAQAKPRFAVLFFFSGSHEYAETIVATIRGKGTREKYRCPR
ncbi:MAG: hypothetical protein LBU25_00205 [Treponema sp.]|nr:hypothetical protein [Treponema sp.]